MVKRFLTNKGILGAAVLLLILTTLLVAVTGCEAQPGSGDNTLLQSDTGETSSGGEATEPPQVPLALSVEDLSGYVLIRPSEASTALVEKIVELRKTVQERLGVTLEFKDDFVKEGTSMTESEHEILVGDCNRKQSAEFMKELKVLDYGYRISDGKLLIAGGSEEKVLEAIDRFISDVLQTYSEEKAEFFTEEDFLIEKGTYRLDTITLNGNGIDSYRVVYPHGQNALKAAASSVATQVRNLTGYRLTVCSDRENPTDGVNEILIGLTNRDTAGIETGTLGEKNCLIATVGKSVWLTGPGTVHVYQAIRAFGQLLQPTAEEQSQKQVEISGSMTLSFEQGTVRAMSFNIKTGISSESDPRISLVVSMITTYLPDSVGFQEVSPVWYKVLKDRLGDAYGYVGVDRNGNGWGEANPVFYRKDRYNLIESGTEWLSDTPTVPESKFAESMYPRIYTYALLENKETGERYMHINTHFDHTSDEARKKQAAVLVAFFQKQTDRGIAFLCTGDYNSKSTSDAYKTIVSSNLVNSGADIAASGEQKTTFQNWGTSSSIIDFIFVSPQLYVDFYRVCDETFSGQYASDHNPIFIDFVLT